MTANQFIVLTWILYACPFIAPAIAIIKNGHSFIRYWVAELIVGAIVFACLFYLQEIGTSNGLVDPAIFMKAGAEAVQLWNPARYSLMFAGLALGIWFIVKSMRSNEERNISRSRQLFGVFCIVYGLAVPQLMNNFLAAVRDSHLLK